MRTKKLFLVMLIVCMFLTGCQKGTKTMFNYSSIIWSLATDSQQSIIAHPIIKSNDDIIETMVESKLGASYTRKVTYMLLKNFEEISFTWTDEAGNTCLNEICYNETMEGEVECTKRFINIDSFMGSGEYILLPIEDCMSENDNIINISSMQIIPTTRAKIIFDDKSEKSNNFVTINSYISYDYPILASRNIQIGSGNQYIYETSKECLELKDISAPIVVNLKNKIDSLDMLNIEISDETVYKVPVVILGVYNNELLEEKYYSEISIDENLIIYPSWVLNVDKNKLNNLRVYIFCYPYENFDELEYIEQVLFADQINTGLYIKYKEQE